MVAMIMSGMRIVITLLLRIGLLLRTAGLCIVSMGVPFMTHRVVTFMILMRRLIMVVVLVILTLMLADRLRLIQRLKPRQRKLAICLRFTGRAIAARFIVRVLCEGQTDQQNTSNNQNKFFHPTAPLS